MIKYYKHLNENGEIIALLSYDFEPNITDPLIVEITEEEYEAISAEWESITPDYKPSETQLKAQAYDIITGVAE